MQKGSFSFVLVHGFLDAGEIWRPVVDAVSPIVGGEWITSDLPGMGTRWQDVGPFTLARFSEELGTYIDGCRLPVILIGHSMGTQLVELAARLRPDQVRGLLLLSPIPLTGTHMPPEMFDALATSGGDLEGQRAVRRGNMGQPADPTVLERLIALGYNVRRDATQAIVAAWNEGVAEGRAPSAFAGPVLVATGDADPFTTRDTAAAVAARFTEASEEVLPGCGHWPHAERPGLVAALIVRFVAFLSADADSTSQNSASGWTTAFTKRRPKYLQRFWRRPSYSKPACLLASYKAASAFRQYSPPGAVFTRLTAGSGLYQALDFTRRTMDGDRIYTEWQARFGGGERVAGITILTTDAAGEISTIAIHHRPLPSALRFFAELGRALVGKLEPDLFYSAK
jgi:pimeloyl-ACP methyl ester carboxylesterase